MKKSHFCKTETLKVNLHGSNSMSEVVTKKYYIWLIVCIISFMASIVGGFFGYVFLGLSGQYAYIALLVVMGLLLIGSIVGIFIIARKLKEVKALKESNIPNI